MPKICAGIVTYNPEIELLKKNINSIISQVDCLIVVDNGSKNIFEISCLLNNRNIFLIDNKDNLGIAKALNQLCDCAFEKNFDWIITLDQDSISPSDLVCNLSKYISDKIAIIAPNIVYKNNESFSDMRNEGVEEAEWVITSASLTNLKIWKSLGGFDEILFIDGVDRDYGIRATKAGYKVIKCYDVKLLHELGSLKCRRRFGRTIYVTNHSALRKYYMVRNAIYLDKKHRESLAQKYIMKNIIKTILYEKDKIEKMDSILKGIKDGIELAKEYKQ